MALIPEPVLRGLSEGMTQKATRDFRAVCLYLEDRDMEDKEARMRILPLITRVLRDYEPTVLPQRLADELSLYAIAAWPVGDRLAHYERLCDPEAEILAHMWQQFVKDFPDLLKKRETADG